MNNEYNEVYPHMRYIPTLLLCNLRYSFFGELALMKQLYKQQAG